MGKDSWVVKYDENSQPIRWMPYEQFIAEKFLGSIWEFTNMWPIVWGRNPITDKDKIYEIAKREYKKYKEVLPLSYLEYYNPEKNG